MTATRMANSLGTYKPAADIDPLGQEPQGVSELAEIVRHFSGDEAGGGGLEKRPQGRSS